jgi:uncharacterized membrane protein
MRMGANHVHQPASASTAPTSRRVVRLIVAVLAPAAALTIAGLIWLWPTGGIDGGEQGDGPSIVKGTVTAVQSRPCPTQPAEGTEPGEEPVPEAAPGQIDCGTVSVMLSSGPDRGKQISTDIPSGPGAVVVHKGDAITLMYLPDDPSDRPYQIQDHQRGLQLWILAAIFAMAVIAFGRLRGVTALVGLAVTFTVLLTFIVPGILDGRSPLLVAIVGSAAIMLTVLYLTHGVSVATSVAVVGTLASLVLTGAFSALATSATRLTGLASEETTYLKAVYGDVDMRGLLLAGIVIGCLGVLDDVTVTQSAIVTELARANPSYSVGQLYQAATRVGRSHIASVVNTIILAYAGASLPVLVLLAAGSQPLGRTLTSQFMAEEIVRGVVGTVGLIAAVPITTLLAAALTARRTSATDPDKDLPPAVRRHAANRRRRHEPAAAALAREEEQLW